MKNEPRIIPMNVGENIYAVLDDRGNTIGTGTREVCEELLFIVLKAETLAALPSPLAPVQRRSNVKSAIAI